MTAMRTPNQNMQKKIINMNLACTGEARRGCMHRRGSGFWIHKSHKNKDKRILFIIIKTNMMKISLALAALLVELPSLSCHRLDPAFIHRRVSIKSRPFNNNNQILLFDESLFEAEEAAAFDAHDVSDAGMEAAAMEAAVIIAADLKEHPLEKEKASKEEKPHDPIVGKVHMLPREEEDAELLDAEDAAAYDAHDVSDAGMEGAAMERAVIMAEELKEQACSKTKEDDTIGDDQPKKTIFGRIKSLLRHEDDTDSDDDLHLLEANYAHDLSDAAALDHAKEITFS